MGENPREKATQKKVFSFLDLTPVLMHIINCLIQFIQSCERMSIRKNKNSPLLALPFYLSTSIPFPSNQTNL